MKTLKKIIDDYNLAITDEVNLSSNRGVGTDKGNPKSYIDNFYEKKFGEYRNRDLIIVEIGVRSGASLKLWSEYFSKNSKIYGLDNLNDKNYNSIPINDEWTSAENVEYIVGDAYTEEISNKINKIDILIDDGPHTLESHINLLKFYCNKINPGGIIIIEDISYDYNQLYVNVPENLKHHFYVCDYGGYDDRLIVIEGF